MRVQIIGDAPSARALRGHLSGFSHVAVVDAKADFVLTINELATGPATVDGVDGPLEFHVLNQLAEALGSVLVLRTDRHRSDGMVTVGLPAYQGAEGERAIFRALTGKLARVAERAPWWRRRLTLAAWLLALLPATAQAQVITPIKCHNGTTAFFCGDAANTALRVNVVASSAGGGAVTQGAGFGVATGFWNVRLTDGTSFYKGLTDTELRATPVPVSGTVAVTSAGLTNLDVALSTRLKPADTLAGVTTVSTVTAVTAITNALPAGTNAIGKLAANSGVDIGDVDVLTLPSVTIGTFPDNEPFNVAQVAGATAQSGSGTATGALRVELPTNGTGVLATVTNVATIGTSVTPGTAAAHLGKAEDAAHTTADVGVMALGVRVDPTTTATTGANSEYGAIAVDHVGAVAVGVHPGRYSCFVPLTTTATTQCQAAAAAGLRNYVTSLHCSNGAATVQGVDVVFGTGAACVTGTTALTHKYQMGTNALTTSPFLVTVYYGDTAPLVPTAATAICLRPTAATAFGCTVTGFIAP